VIAPFPRIGTRRIKFQPSSSLIEFDTLERARPSVSAMSSAVIGRSDRNSSAWIWLTERLTPHCPPISPQCSTKRSMAIGSGFLLSVISVMTEISDETGEKSRRFAARVNDWCPDAVRRPDPEADARSL
jgi:hypothetical protein